MKKEKAWKPPISLIVLDAIGAILLGLGLAERFAATNLVPKSLQFENYDLVMIVVGGLLMVPMLLNVIEHARSKAKNGT